MPSITFRPRTAGAAPDAQPTSDATGAAGRSKPSGSKHHVDHAAGALPSRSNKSPAQKQAALKQRIMHVAVTELPASARPSSTLPPLVPLPHAPIFPLGSAVGERGLQSDLPPQRPARPPGHDPLAGMYPAARQDEPGRPQLPRRPERPPGHDPLAGLYAPSRPAESGANAAGRPEQSLPRSQEPADPRAAVGRPAAPNLRELNYRPDWDQLPNLARAVRNDPPVPDET